jgi:hypothetical protein
MPGRRQAYHSSKEWRIGSWPSLSLRKWRQIGPTARGRHCYSSSRTHHSSKGNSASSLAEMLSDAHGDPLPVRAVRKWSPRSPGQRRSRRRTSEPGDCPQNLSAMAEQHTLRSCSVRSGRRLKSIPLSATRSAYPGRPSFPSQSAICRISAAFSMVATFALALLSAVFIDRHVLNVETSILRRRFPNLANSRPVRKIASVDPPCWWGERLIGV